jgi:hypothetical protein
MLLVHRNLNNYRTDVIQALGGVEVRSCLSGLLHCIPFRGFHFLHHQKRWPCTY